MRLRRFRDAVSRGGLLPPAAPLGRRAVGDGRVAVKRQPQRLQAIGVVAGIPVPVAGGNHREEPGVLVLIHAPVVLLVDASKKFQPVIKMWAGKLPRAAEVLAVLKPHEDQSGSPKP